MAKAKPSLADKDFLTPTEAAVHFNLSRRKFYALLKEGSHSFVAMYGERKLIIKTDLIKYLAQPVGKTPCLSLRELEKQIGKDMDS